LGHELHRHFHRIPHAGDHGFNRLAGALGGLEVRPQISFNPLAVAGGSMDIFQHRSQIIINFVHFALPFLFCL
jgi:hypothetical protein